MLQLLVILACLGVVAWLLLAPSRLKAPDGGALVVASDTELDEEIELREMDGFEVHEREPGRAVLVWKPQFDPGLAVLFALTGVGLVLYLGWYVFKSDERLEITIDPSGAH